MFGKFRKLTRAVVRKFIWSSRGDAQKIIGSTRARGMHDVVQANKCFYNNLFEKLFSREFFDKNNYFFRVAVGHSKILKNIQKQPTLTN